MFISSLLDPIELRTRYYVMYIFEVDFLSVDDHRILFWFSINYMLQVCCSGITIGFRGFWVTIKWNCTDTRTELNFGYSGFGLGEVNLKRPEPFDQKHRPHLEVLQLYKRLKNPIPKPCMKFFWDYVHLLENEYSFCNILNYFLL